MKVNTFKMKNGEEFVAEVLNSGEFTEGVTIKNPVVLARTGEGQYIFTPWIGSAKEDQLISIENDLILATLKPNDNVLENYENMFGVGILTAVPKIVI